MKHEGRGVIRMGDKTDHGGQVLSVSSGTKVMGLEAALENDMTFCPRCKGQFRSRQQQGQNTMGNLMLMTGTRPDAAQN